MPLAEEETVGWQEQTGPMPRDVEGAPVPADQSGPAGESALAVTGLTFPSKNGG